jgi:hypothetical protein
MGRIAIKPGPIRAVSINLDITEFVGVGSVFGRPATLNSPTARAQAASH